MKKLYKNTNVTANAIRAFATDACKFTCWCYVHPSSGGAYVNSSASPQNVDY